MLSIAKKMFGSENERKLKKMRPLVAQINDLEPKFEKLTDEALKAQTDIFRQRFKDGETLDDLLPEAFAVVREAAKRTLEQRHYDVQLIGGISLHRGDIAEMRTGEGKTLVATLAVYLNALNGLGVHVITVNDYLASRDAEWMSEIYSFLGMTTGCIVHGLSDAERKAAYNCDITYGTNNEFGFDYLRDNMKYSLDAMAQRGHIFCIIDEIDSILIDEARTPLIISGPTDDRSEFYRLMDALIPLIDEDGYDVDEKSRSATFNEAGTEQIEALLTERDMLEGESLYDVENVTVVHHINQALKAHKIFHVNKDYIVKDDKVVLIDEFTGRMMDGRRLSEGLHQAIEAKENVEIQPENVTLASVTFQNYFRLYDKLAGMTGTALTEASEFHETYKLDVLEIPTNRPIMRIDDDDVIYRTEIEKFNAIVDEIRECQTKGQPMLVGTVSIEKSEKLSQYLTEKGIEHRVLNARYHEQEAAIVAQAGVPGSVTIATNMAGRGTDIQLGGNLDMRLEQEAPAGETPHQKAKREEKTKDEISVLKKQALDAGGLYVLATERHESRRIDNQLRGRTGRQGDPGRSKFYISTEDDLMRIFGGERLKNMMGKIGWEEGESLTSRFMSKAVERAQSRVEARNFDIRKNLLKYDDVMNDQRKAIFEQRLEFMTDDHVSDVIEDMRHGVCESLIGKYVPRKAYAEQWDIEGLTTKTREILALDLPVSDWAAEEGIADEEMLERMKNSADTMFSNLSEPLGKEQVQSIEKQVLLQVIDENWREHLKQLDSLKQVVGMRGYAQRDPLNEFKSEAFTLFDKLLNNLREGVTQNMSRLLVQVMMQNQQRQQMEEQAAKAAPARAPRGPQDMLSGMSLDRSDEPSGSIDDLDPKLLEGLSRNAPCPCGSGRKVKHCHGNVRRV
ncbi:preprotein translocase subunit SecA [Robiginitomaculum antarcticum]|uniref:preprotein translocase subunit SecA n=1 Tax=Robiginitomaculum antarcticum TaxID=437507 RepID=UPI00037342D1|nr:preprotein translocase subunit SecA [Robiginitomaculum antarcticum]